MTPRGRALKTTLLTALVAGAVLAPASAQAQSSPEPFAPYDGSNPFKCELQDVGTGTDFPDPDADPFCVKFDKTSQNVTDFGLADFLSKEPERVSAAGPKCFYYQQDEWTGSIVQGEQPETWHWVGGYFFDKARGIGGVSVRQFRVGGTPFSAAPYAPPEYAPYFDEAGGGGVVYQYATDPGLGCEAMADTPEERGTIIRDESAISQCIEPGGPIRGRRVGAVTLGKTRKEIRGKLGKPAAKKGRAVTWCVTGGDYVQAIFRRAPAGAVLIRTTVVGHAVKNVGAGTGSRRAIRRLDLEPLFAVSGVRVYEADRPGRGNLLVGIGGRKVRWLALTDPQAFRGQGSLKRSLRHAIDA